MTGASEGVLPLGPDCPHTILGCPAEDPPNVTWTTGVDNMRAIEPLPVGGPCCGGAGRVGAGPV